MSKEFLKDILHEQIMENRELDIMCLESAILTKIEQYKGEWILPYVTRLTHITNVYNYKHLNGTLNLVIKEATLSRMCEGLQTMFQQVRNQSYYQNQPDVYIRFLNYLLSAL